jgi:dTDP-4-amino-4,6-dideoxygalactose transaminase
VLKSPFLTLGPKIQEFERQVADYVGAKLPLHFQTERLLFMGLVLQLVSVKEMKL